MISLTDRLTVSLERFRNHLTGEKKRRRRYAAALFDAAVRELGPGDLAVDLGANHGDYTVKLAATGAMVHAFEPDPYTFSKLQLNLAAYPNVVLHQKAAGVRDGKFPLFRHSNFDADPDAHGIASSLLADHRKVGQTPAAMVEVIDFVAFLEALSAPVALLKIDIEGAEVDLMEALLAHPVSGRIGKIFVETHERLIPSHVHRIRALRAQTAAIGTPMVNWDWH